MYVFIVLNIFTSYFIFVFCIWYSVRTCILYFVFLFSVFYISYFTFYILHFTFVFACTLRFLYSVFCFLCNIYFIFCILYTLYLHFAFCILYFVFCIILTMYSMYIYSTVQYSISFLYKYTWIRTTSTNIHHSFIEHVPMYQNPIHKNVRTVWHTNIQTSFTFPVPI